MRILTESILKNINEEDTKLFNDGNAIFTLSLDLSDESYEGSDIEHEVSMILSKLAAKFDSGRSNNSDGPVLDVNGNTIGKYEFTYVDVSTSEESE